MNAMVLIGVMACSFAGEDKLVQRLDADFRPWWPATPIACSFVRPHECWKIPRPAAAGGSRMPRRSFGRPAARQQFPS